MSITEDRVTIFTKNTGKYSGIALILDLTRSINHTYGSSVASHPIEGSGNTVADHQYLKNIKIQISGHVSNGVKVPQLAERVDNFTFTRDNNAYISELHDERNKIYSEIEEINSLQIPEGEDYLILTQEDADLLNKYSGIPGYYTENQAFNDTELTVTQELSNQEAELQDSSIIKSIRDTEEDDAKNRAESKSNGQRRVYASSQLNKQLDALILLENIRDNRLLVDVLTPNRLYRDMTLNFNLPRNMRQGTALEVNCVFEQQRFVEAEVESLPYSIDSDLIDDKDTKDEKPKEVKDPANVKRAEDILNTTIVKSRK